MSLVQENMRGLIISQRPDEIMTNKLTKINPFNSTFPINNPTGYNPVTRPKVIVRNPNETFNKVHSKNKQILNELSKARHIRHLTAEEEDNLRKRKKKNKKIRSSAENKLLDEIKKEIHDEVYNQDNHYGQDLVDSNAKLPQINNFVNKENNQDKYSKKAPEEEIINDYFVNPIKTESAKDAIPKISSDKKPKWCLTKEEADNKEAEELINFMANLDFEKYIKNLEIREALYLIKNKVDNGGSHEFAVSKIRENEATQNPNFPVENSVKQEERKDNRSKYDEDYKLNNREKVLPLVHESNWDSGNKLHLENLPKINNEIMKKNIAEEVIKQNNAFKTVHSVQSVKKMLERQGVFDGESIKCMKELENQLQFKNPFKDVAKDRKALFYYPEKASNLPFLHEYPVV